MTRRLALLCGLFVLGLAAGASAQGNGPALDTATRAMPRAQALDTATRAMPPAPAPASTAPPARRQRSAAQTAQQERMRACNAQATQRSLRGDARRGFMSTCLSGRDSAPQPTASSSN